MKRIKRTVFSLIILSLCLSINCDDKNEELISFSIEDDMDLGAMVAIQIATDPEQFPILPRTNTTACPNCASAYSYLDNMVVDILNSQDGEGDNNVVYRNEFAWEVQMIYNDEIKNIFVSPGGYIYIYTGLIKTLDRADDLAGVIGHEIAHVDWRHSSKQLQRQYGVSLLLRIIHGKNPDQLADLVNALAGSSGSLSFTRGMEIEADKYSVIYLSDTDYACNGAFSFFQNLIGQQLIGNTPGFLRSHPDPASRINAINEKATELGCSTDAFLDNDSGNGVTDYLRFKEDWLPD